MNVGVTGHQRLDDPTAWCWVERAIDHELETLDQPLVGVTSLAIGADQLFARLVVHRGGRIHAVIPFAEYEGTLDEEGAEEYRKLISHAEIEVLDLPGTEQDAYLAAGKRVVALSELMIAVWDSQPAKGKGGTADIVAYAQGRHVPLVHINPHDRMVARR